MTESKHMQTIKKIQWKNTLVFLLFPFHSDNTFIPQNQEGNMDGFKVCKIKGGGRNNQVIITGNLP